jgi:hypothetical protein
MRAILLALLLVACGGKTSGSTSDSGATSSSPPAPGTSACDDPPSAVCVMCSDGKYHCGARAAGGAAGEPDASFEECKGAGTCGSGGTPCVNCEAGAFCLAILNPGGDNDVESTSAPITCQ